MKRAFFFFFVIFATPCLAQWRNIGLGNPNGGDISNSPIAMGTLDTSVFVSVESLNNIGPLIWRISPSSSGWTPADGGIYRAGVYKTDSITTFASVGSKLFAGSDFEEANAYLLTNEDSSWSYIDPAGGPVGTNGSYIFGYYFSHIARSRDGGKTWDHLSADAGNYYAGSGACVFSSSPYGIWHSIDSGSTWSRDTLLAGLSLSAFASLGSDIFAGGNGIYLSTDSGQTWAQTGLARRTVNALAVYKRYLFAGTDSGIFISSDSGLNWRDVSDNMGAQSSWAKTYYPNVKLLAVLDTIIFASVDAGINHYNRLDYGYITNRPISEMTSPASVVQAMPAGDTIAIYPNPASGMVSIRSGGTSILGVRVLNVLGEKVLDVSARRESDVMLDLSKLPSGTYFIEIQTTNGFVLRKVVRE